MIKIYPEYTPYTANFPRGGENQFGNIGSVAAKSGSLLWPTLSRGRLVLTTQLIPR